MFIESVGALESHEEILQRISDQRAENLIKAHERIKELEAKNLKMRKALNMLYQSPTMRTGDRAFVQLILAEIDE